MAQKGAKIGVLGGQKVHFSVPSVPLRGLFSADFGLRGGTAERRGCSSVRLRVTRAEYFYWLGRLGFARQLPSHAEHCNSRIPKHDAGTNGYCHDRVR